MSYNSTIYINIKQLLQTRDAKEFYVSGNKMDELPKIHNAFLLVENGIIIDFGAMVNIPKKLENTEVIDLSNSFVMPTWCDAHTHSVFAGNRSNEYLMRLQGLTYKQIADGGGGILKTTQEIKNISEEELYSISLKRILKMIQNGSGSIEIKSGYGLSYESELKILNVIKKLKDNLPIEIKSTFLGAHAYPKELTKKEYLNLILNKMIPDFTKKKLVDYVDIFCEKGYFGVSDSEKIIKKAKQLKVPAKIHVNQFNNIGGIQMAVTNDLVSVDHLEILDDNDIHALKNSKTMPVLLPGCSFFLDIPYAPAKKLIKNNIPFALASDFNPGSSPNGNMNFIVSLACNKLKITSEQAINAATLNGAYAMGINEKCGSICKGKLANFIILKEIDSINDIVYYYNDNLIKNVIIKGRVFNS